MEGSPRKTLRRLLAGGDIVVAPGAYDALTARLIEQAGLAARAGAIVEATALPVIADADTGYGNALNVQRTIRAYERAGVAALHLEDQAAPKRCGHLRGKELIPAAEMCGKIHAACDARRDPDLIIIARTDARAAEGLEAALERARRYAAAGADVLFVEAPESEEELRRIPRELTVPTMANMVEGGRTPLVPAPRLQAWGYRLVIFANAAARTATKAVMGLLEPGSDALVGRAEHPPGDRRVSGGGAPLRLGEMTDRRSVGPGAPEAVGHGGPDRGAGHPPGGQRGHGPDLPGPLPPGAGAGGDRAPRPGGRG
jgi:2-methylisocitrate lyase-like PEP mutase family enzyme